MNILFLTTPAQHGYNNPSVAMDTKALKHWLAKLPTSNVLETVNRLREAIETFNETQLDDAKRIKLLELYKETLDLILYSYDELRLRQLPIPDVQRKSLAEDIMWLYLGLSNGYKTVVLHSHQNQLIPSQDTKLLLAVYRAMELIIHALIYAFRSAHPVPPLAYLELNQLYLFAEQDNALTQPVKGVTGHAVTATIDVLFKQFMLLIAADPATIKSTQLYELHNALETFTINCTMHSGYPDKKSHHKYWIDLMEDTAPQLANNSSATIASDTSRTLDISPALSDIDAWITTHSTPTMDCLEEHESLLLTEYLSSIKKTWALTEFHLPGNTPLTLAVGIGNIHHLLGETGALRQFTHQTMAEKNLNLIKTAVIHTNWQLVDSQRTTLIVQGKFTNTDTTPSIGDIVGLSSAQPFDKADIIIASVIAITNCQGDMSTLEVQLINNDPTPITCRLLEKDGNTIDCIDGLYFQRDNKLEKPASLLTPKTVIEQQYRIRVTVHGITYDVIPGASLHQTNQYIQFRFKAEKIEGV